MPKIRASGTVGVKVTGLNELNRALRDMGGREFQKELKEAGMAVASSVAADAKGHAMSLGGVAAKTAPSIRAAAGFTSAGVGFGGSGYPFAMGAEFGSVRFKQFKPWRGSGSDAGYFVFQSIRDNADNIGEEYLAVVDDVLRKHGLK